MSVEAILMHFEAFFFLSYHAYFTSISCNSDANDSFLNPHQQCINKFFDPRWVSSIDGIKLDSLLVLLIQISVVVLVFFLFCFFWRGGGGGGGCCFDFFSSINT